MTARMNRIIEQCKYEATEKDVNARDGSEVLKKTEKIDLKKFRTAYVSINVNEDIKHQIQQTRMRKQEREI